MVVVVDACSPLTHPLVLELFEHHLKVLVTNLNIAGCHCLAVNMMCDFPSIGTLLDVSEKPAIDVLASGTATPRFVEFAQEAP